MSDTLIEMSAYAAKREKARIVTWLRKYFHEHPNAPQNVVLGISGGKDSTVAASLCVRALGSDRVTGVLMPNGCQVDLNDSKEVCGILGINSLEIDIESIYKQFMKDLDQAYSSMIVRSQLSRDIDISNIELSSCESIRLNLPPRIRMCILYALAPKLNALVVNTCNRSEDYIGWSTKYGDSAGDIAPLQHLTKTEVVAIGRAMNLPDHLINKVPADGLTGKTDEENFRFSYNLLDNYLLEGICVSDSLQESIDFMHQANLHKMQPMPHLDPIIRH